jgi:phenylpyruvate tautomerase PptA (4-oxalocrotonate tautomerase family)
MPLCRISVPQHLPASQVKALAEAVHSGLMSTCDVSIDNHFQLITRHEADEMILNPTYGGVARTRDACIVEILLLKGRTDKQKRALYRQVNDLAVAAGFKADDIMITLVENELIDWTVGCGQTFDKLP